MCNRERMSRRAHEPPTLWRLMHSWCRSVSGITQLLIVYDYYYVYAVVLLAWISLFAVNPPAGESWRYVRASADSCRLIAMSSEYSNLLEGDNKERYIWKVKVVYGVLGSTELQHLLSSLDPYKIPAETWVDDVTKWPRIEFGHVYVYLVDNPGGYTREALKAFKSLEAYNYYLRWDELTIPLNKFILKIFPSFHHEVLGPDSSLPWTWTREPQPFVENKGHSIPASE